MCCAGREMLQAQLACNCTHFRFVFIESAADTEFGSLTENDTIDVNTFSAVLGHTSVVIQN